MSSRMGSAGASRISLIAITIAVTVTAYQLSSLTTTLVGPSLNYADSEASQLLDEFVTEHVQLLDSYRRQFNERSLFFTPEAPMPETVPEPTPPPLPLPPLREQEPDVQETIRYNGPPLFGIFDDQAWFGPSTTDRAVFKLTVGETARGLELTAMAPPICVHVRYNGKHHKLGLFEPWSGNLPFPEVAIDTTATEAVDDGGHADLADLGQTPFQAPKLVTLPFERQISEDSALTDRRKDPSRREVGEHQLPVESGLIQDSPAQPRHADRKPQGRWNKRESGPTKPWSGTAGNRSDRHERAAGDGLTNWLEIPESVTQSQLESMSISELWNLLFKCAKAKRHPSVDSEVRRRLEREFDLIWREFKRKRKAEWDVT